jgi:oligopeptidase B
VRKAGAGKFRFGWLPIAGLLVCTFFTLQFWAQSSGQAPASQPPVAKKIPHTTEINGRTLVDNYFWLRDKKNPEVRAYLEAENAYTGEMMKSTDPLQKKLYEEMLSRVKETDVDVPYKEGNYYYYSRTEAGKQYQIRCRKKGSLDAPEEVILDINQLAVGQKFMSVGDYEVSDDGNYLAYTTDDTGFRQYTLSVKDLRTGKLLPDHAVRVGSVTWANDNHTIFYTQEDAQTKRDYRLYRHILGSTGADDKLLYEEKDEKFDVDSEKTRSKGYILLTIANHTTSEVRYIPADHPNAEWKLMEPRRQDIQYFVDHHGDSFYIRVNDMGRNFRLVKAPVSDPRRDNWQELIPHRPDVMISGISFFRDFYVRQERQDGLPQLVVTDLKSGASHKIDFPEPAYSAYSYENRDYDSSKYRYGYQSFITPPTVFEYDTQTGVSTVLKRKEVPHFDPTRYKVERIYATASDGVKIPISVVRLKGASLDGKGPLYMYGYGSYGVSMDIRFSSNIFSMVDRGVVVAIAHIRGGGELGKPWHDAGRMMNKKTTFTDFISCGEYLLAQGYGSKERFGIEGRSAGGLLMGAVLNMRPDLFKAALVGVPFVDVINTMLDESLPLTVPEFEEWGNPKEKAAFDYMISYSPYDNIENKPYPSMLVRTSFNDSQVMYWEPAKYVAKMRATRTDHNLLMLKTNMDPAGHGGASGRYDVLHEAAFDYAFFLTQMGIQN